MTDSDQAKGQLSFPKLKWLTTYDRSEQLT